MLDSQIFWAYHKIRENTMQTPGKSKDFFVSVMAWVWSLSYQLSLISTTGWGHDCKPIYISYQVDFYSKSIVATRLWGWPGNSILSVCTGLTSMALLQSHNLLADLDQRRRIRCLLKGN